MTWLILGLLLWSAAHLFKRRLPARRQAPLGSAGRGLVAVGVLAGLVLMIVGYRAAETDILYALPLSAWHLNNLLMLVAVYLMGAGQAGVVVAAKLRHPMLSGVVVWAVAHLLVNGDAPSLLLFGGLGLWAVVEMAVINRAEDAWSPSAPGPLRNDAKVALFAVVLYAVIAGVHHWLDRPVFPGLA